MRIRRQLAVLGALLSVACGGGGGTTNPPPTVTLASITLSPASLALNAGQSQAITPSAIDTDGKPIGSASGYIYSSGNNGIAVVDAAGTVVGLSAGPTQVTVSLTLNGVTKQATAPVTVSGTLPGVVSVEAGSGANVFTPASVAVARNGTVTYTFGAVVHNVDFQGVSGAPSNIGNASNASVDRTFQNAGIFQYVCTIHSGMSGRVLVP